MIDNKYTQAEQYNSCFLSKATHLFLGESSYFKRVLAQVLR